jgi:hypothetical protein
VTSASITSIAPACTAAPSVTVGNREMTLKPV